MRLRLINLNLQSIIQGNEIFLKLIDFLSNFFICYLTKKSSFIYLLKYQFTMFNIKDLIIISIIYFLIYFIKYFIRILIL